MSVRIVVADDDPFIRRLVMFTLKKRGHIVIEAADGEAALKLIQQEHPDIAVLDVIMPGLTGLEVTKALASDPVTARIPVLILSASAQAAEIEAGLASGASSYLVKPFEPKALGDRVAEMIAEQRSDAPKSAA